MDIAKIIKDIRAKMGLTQKEFADMLCVSESTVQKWEAGKNSPTIEMFSEIISLLNKKLIVSERIEEEKSDAAKADALTKSLKELRQRALVEIAKSKEQKEKTKEAKEMKKLPSFMAYKLRSRHNRFDKALCLNEKEMAEALEMNTNYEYVGIVNLKDELEETVDDFITLTTIPHAEGYKIVLENGDVAYIRNQDAMFKFCKSNDVKEVELQVLPEELFDSSGCEAV